MRRKLTLGLASVAMLAAAAGAFGCTVCFGESDDPIVKGAEASVLFMVIVTYLLLGSGVAAAFLLRRRARRLAEQNVAATSTQPPSHPAPRTSAHRRSEITAQPAPGPQLQGACRQ